MVLLFLSWIHGAPTEAFWVLGQWRQANWCVRHRDAELCSVLKSGCVGKARALIRSVWTLLCCDGSEQWDAVTLPVNQNV